MQAVKYGQHIDRHESHVVALGNVDVHVPDALWPMFCERVKTALLGNEMEPCCECGEDYPRAELLAGEVYCAKCRAARKQKLKNLGWIVTDEPKTTEEPTHV